MSKHYYVEFFVVDEDYCEVSKEICNCINSFNTYIQARNIAIKLSKIYKDKKFSVSCCIPSTQFKNGKEID